MSMTKSAGMDILPNELKKRIFEHLGIDDRLALRSCSKNLKQSVDSLQFNIFDYVKITTVRAELNYQMIYEQVRHYKTESFCTDSTKTIEPAFRFRMDSIDYLKELIIDEDIPLVHLEDVGRKLKVGSLELCGDEFVSAFIIQTEPRTLKKLRLRTDNDESDVYDLEQVIHAKHLSVDYHCCITDEQLMNLRAKRIYLGGTSNLTAAGLNRFIKKIIKNGNFEEFSLKLPNDGDFGKICEGLDVEKNGSDVNALIVKTDFPDFELKLRISRDFLSGEKVKKRAGNTLRVIKTMKVCADSIELTEVDATHEFHYPGEDKSKFNKTLEQLMNSNIYFKNLQLVNCYDSMDPSLLKKKISAGSFHMSFWNIINRYRQSFDVIDKFNRRDKKILRMLDTSCLKEVVITFREVGQKVFDMKQIRMAEKLHIVNCTIRDDQLLKLNARHIKIENKKGKYITAAGLNKFIKKCLQNLNKVNYCVQIRMCDYEENSKDVLKGINHDVFSGICLINSKWPSYKMRFELLSNGIVVFERIITSFA